MIKKNWRTRWKKTVAARHFPLSPPCQEWPILFATRNISSYFSSSNPPAGVRRTDRSPCSSRTLLPARGPAKPRRSGHLCTNPSGSAGLEFQFFPAPLPLPGHKPVLLDESVRSSDYKAIPAMLFFRLLFHSSNFYWVHYFWWAGWYFLQKWDESILNFCMFLYRKTLTIIYRQLCQNGNFVSDPLIC